MANISGTTTWAMDDTSNNYGYYYNTNGTTTTGSNTIRIQGIHGPTYNTKQEYYEALASAVKDIAQQLDSQGAQELQIFLKEQLSGLLAEVMIVVEGPLGPTYRIKPNGMAHIYARLEMLVNKIILDRVTVLLRKKAGELQKLGTPSESSTPVDQPTPTTLLSEKAAKLGHRDDQATYGYYNKMKKKYMQGDDLPQAVSIPTWDAQQLPQQYGSGTYVTETVQIASDSDLYDTDAASS